MSITRHDWSLQRKGMIDQERHAERVRDAIRKNLGSIVSNESIILSDGKRTVKVPIKSLDEYKFRFDHNKRKHVGQGDGNSNVGDVIAREGGQGQPGRGRGNKAGREGGGEYYEADVQIDEIAKLIFEDLRLPFLEDKAKQSIAAPQTRFNEIRKTGVMSNLDKRRMILENIKRNAREAHKLNEQEHAHRQAEQLDANNSMNVSDEAAEQDADDKQLLKHKPRFANVKREDLRFKSWEEETRYESNAVVIAVMDVSGSMTEFKKYIARSFYFWMVRFLRTKYDNVKIRFISHHTEAREVTEEQFFTQGESGGTVVSSAYELALGMIKKDYNPRDWNIYPFHFSDGDNYYSDNDDAVKLADELIATCNLFGYGEISDEETSHYRRASGALLSVFNERLKNKKRFIGVRIDSKEDVYPALQTFFKEQA